MFESIRPEILTYHAVLVDDQHVSFLNVFKLFFQLVDVLFFGSFHLPHDFFLGIQLTVQVLSFWKCLVYLMLVLKILLVEKLNLFLRGYELDFTSFNGQNLVFQLTFNW